MSQEWALSASRVSLLGNMKSKITCVCLQGETKDGSPPSISLEIPYPEGEFSPQKQAFNKLTSVFHASVLLLIMNFVITLSK